MATRFFFAALSLLGVLVPAAVLAEDLVESPSYGVVESVREVRLTEDLPGLLGVFELAYKPPSADELLVTLDDGRAVTVVRAGARIFAPGQRVHVALDGPDVRIENAEGHSLP